MPWPNPEKFFGKDACNLCGECLHQCEFLRLSHKEARQEMVRLVKGKETKYVLQKCRSCGRCNDYCPRHMDVLTLIVTRQFEKHQKKGIPVKCLFALPLVDNNIWTSTYKYLPEEEKALLESWSDVPAKKEVIYAGCAARLFPYLLDSRLFKNTGIMGSLGFCGGGMHYQAGLLNVVEFLSGNIAKKLQNSDIRKFVMVCPSCNFMFRRIMPDYLDIKFDFKMQSIPEWLWENIETGKIKISRKIGKKVAVQEACHAKAGNQLSAVKKILDAIGAEIITMENNSAEVDCCGMGAVAIHFDPYTMLANGINQWKKAKKAGADIMLTYCPGCLLVLAGAKKFYPGRMDIYHVIELVQLAMGETPAHRHRRMASRSIKGMVIKGFPRMFSGKRLLPEAVLEQVRSNINRL